MHCSRLIPRLPSSLSAASSTMAIRFDLSKVLSDQVKPCAQHGRFDTAVRCAGEQLERPFLLGVLPDRSSVFSPPLHPLDSRGCCCRQFGGASVPTMPQRVRTAQGTREPNVNDATVTKIIPNSFGCHSLAERHGLELNPAASAGLRVRFRGYCGDGRSDVGPGHCRQCGDG
jgi:hypothetical protein